MLERSAEYYLRTKCIKHKTISIGNGYISIFSFENSIVITFAQPTIGIWQNFYFCFHSCFDKMKSIQYCKHQKMACRWHQILITIIPISITKTWRCIIAVAISAKLLKQLTIHLTQYLTLHMKISLMKRTLALPQITKMQQLFNAQ